MFERTDFVYLADKKIPEFYKRKEITDIKNRSIKGEWITIDRKNETVKFRREDGKEFDLAIADLAPQDRHYAELETGYLWQIDPLPTPLDIITEDILSFESMNDTHVFLRCVNPSNPGFRYVPKFEINLLTDSDRALIKAKTGRELPVLPRPAPDGNRRAWKYPKALFGSQVPKFTEGYYPATMKLMRQTYSPVEVVDAVRTRTMNSSFIHEYNQLKFDDAEPEMKTGTKPLAEILEIIGEVPSPTDEQKSIRPIIAKLKLSLYEEKVPRDPAEPKRFIRDGRSILSQPGVPIDGELQAYYFMAQCLRLASNKNKIPLATLLENTPYKFTGLSQVVNGEEINYPPEQRRKIYRIEDILPGIEKTFGYKPWKVFMPEKMRNYLKPGNAVRELFDQLNIELIRQHIRKGMPVYAREKIGNNSRHGTQLVITGFKAEKDKPLIFEVISINGSIWEHDEETGEYEISVTTIPATDIDTMTITYLETP